MAIPLNNLVFETSEGTWRTHYIGEPSEPIEGDRVNYYLRFKWVDPNNPENKATPERRLRLTIYPSESANGEEEYEQRLKSALRTWADGTDDCEAIFRWDDPFLRRRS